MFFLIDCIFVTVFFFFFEFTSKECKHFKTSLEELITFPVFMKFIYVLFLICLERESYIHDFPDFLVKIENGGV